MHITLGTIKLIAKAIEYKFPGSCTDLIKALDDASQHPAYIKYRMKEVQDKWDDYKDKFSDKEISELSDKTDFDLSDPTQWDNIIAKYHPEIVPGTNTSVDNLDTPSDDISLDTDIDESVIPDTDTDFWGDVAEFFKELFD